MTKKLLLALPFVLLTIGPAGAAEEAAAAAARPTGQAAHAIHSPEEEMAALRPVLIGKRYLDQARRRLAVQLARMSWQADNPEQWFEDNALVVRDFIADVQVMYALEFPDSPRLVSHGMMKSWGMDYDRLHQRAMANLEEKHGDFSYKPVGKLPWLHVIDSGDGYAASRILLHWRWAELTLKLGEALVLGMPTRDVVVFTASLEPERIEQLRETVETVERHQGRPITRTLFQWTPQGWQPLE